MNPHFFFSRAGCLFGFLLLAMSLSGCGGVEQGDCSPCPGDDQVMICRMGITGQNSTVVCESSDEPMISYDADHYSDRFYDPEVIPIDRGAITDFHPCRPLTLVNCQQNSLMYLGEYTHEWFGNPRQWTMTLLHSLEREWYYRNGIVSGSGDRMLSLRVTDAHISWQSEGIECLVSAFVRTGNGDDFLFTAINRDTDLYGSCNMAVATIVTTILNAEEIRHYLPDCGESSSPISDNDSSRQPDNENTGHGEGQSLQQLPAR